MELRRGFVRGVAPIPGCSGVEHCFCATGDSFPESVGGISTGSSGSFILTTLECATSLCLIYSLPCSHAEIVWIKVVPSCKRQETNAVVSTFLRLPPTESLIRGSIKEVFRCVGRCCTLEMACRDHTMLHVLNSSPKGRTLNCAAVSLQFDRLYPTREGRTCYLCSGSNKPF